MMIKTTLIDADSLIADLKVLIERHQAQANWCRENNFADVEDEHLARAETYQRVIEMVKT